MNFNIQFSTSAFFPLLLLVVALLFTFLIYRNTTPIVSNWLRRSLAILRAFALAASLLLLFEPILSLAVQRSLKPAIAVLIDNSASMSLSDSTESRAEMARETLRGDWREELSDDADIYFYSFSDSLKPLDPDSLGALQFNGDGSNIAAALNSAKEQLAGRFYHAAILLTDGAHNLGNSPSRLAETYGVPIITTDFGSSRQTRDVKIAEIITNEIAYAETRLPLEATISAEGYNGRRTKLRIYEGENEIATEEIVLPQDNTLVSARLDILPKKLGLNRYTAKVDEIDGELTSENNRRVFYVRVLKSKINLWIFAGAPSADFSFLKRALEGDQNFQVTGFVQRPGGQFYRSGSQSLPSPQSQTEWKKVDGVIFVDFPRRDSDQNVLNTLAAQLVANGKPLFYLHGPEVDLQRLWQFRSALPIVGLPTKLNEQAEVVQFEPVGATHPITRPLTAQSASSTASRDLASLTELPPLFYNLTNLKAISGSEVLASISAKGRFQRNRSTQLPAWIAHKTAARKTMAIFTYGLWRWNMLLRAASQASATYDNLVRGIVRWMVTKEDAKLVRIESNKEIYRGGEEIEIVAQVYYEDYRPMEGANVKVQITGPKFQQDMILQDAGNGLYRAKLQVLAGGEYTFEGSAELGGQTIGGDSGRFSVEPFSLEFLDTRFNEPLLKQLAAATNGAYTRPDSLKHYLASLSLQAINRVESYDFAIWGKPAVLIVLILVLCFEWFVRRRQGML